LATFVNRPRRGRRNVAGNSTGKRELLEQLLEPDFVLADVRINLTVGAFEVSIAHQRRAAVTGTGKVEHVQVILLDDPVQMHIDEVLARRRAPVSNHQHLHVRQFQRLLQQRVVVEINLADRKIVGGAPVGIYLVEQFWGESLSIHGSVPFFQLKRWSGDVDPPQSRLQLGLPLTSLSLVSAHDNPAGWRGVRRRYPETYR